MTSFTVGVLLIATAILVVGAILLTARDRLRSTPVTLALAAAGVAVASGGSMLQGSVSIWDRLFATVVLAVVVPLHARVAFGSSANGE